ncbi:MAG: hypothetical protein AAGF20_08855, partial [Pseudomonadota bacterium]
MTETLLQIGAIALIGVPLVLYYVWRQGHFSHQSDKKADREIEISRINNKVENIKARKTAIEAGELDEPLRPKSRRL